MTIADKYKTYSQHFKQNKAVAVGQEDGPNGTVLETLEYEDGSTSEYVYPAIYGFHIQAPNRSYRA